MYTQTAVSEDRYYHPIEQKPQQGPVSLSNASPSKLPVCPVNVHALVVVPVTFTVIAVVVANDAPVI